MLGFSIVCHECGHCLYDGRDTIHLFRLRRKTDIARSLVEKTRGDAATAVQQEKLLAELLKLKKTSEEK